VESLRKDSIEKRRRRDDFFTPLIWTSRGFPLETIREREECGKAEPAAEKAKCPTVPACDKPGT